MNYSTIKDRLDTDKQYRRLLFPRAYIFTDAELGSLQEYPFYDDWDRISIGKYRLLVHRPARAYFYADGNAELALVGHAYNPFTGEIDEQEIARGLVSAYSEDMQKFFDKLDELTGVFVVILIHSDKVISVQDCGGQKMLYFGNVNDNVVITSCPQLVADVFNLQPDNNVLRLLQSKGYYRGSGFLPGNLSPYKELKRLGANTLVYYNKGEFRIERFFPRAEVDTLQSEEDKIAAIKQMYRLMSANIDLTVKKWPRVALSLTGGMDSKTALACATEYYKELYIYSFASKESEKLDADAAAEICRTLEIPHHFYHIPDRTEDIKDYDFLQSLIEHNTSHTCKLHQNEKRKYIWMERLDDFDVEIKSDISEIGRAYTTRKYLNVRIPSKLCPRHLTIGQGRYFLEPWQMLFADKAYREFMCETGLTDDLHGYSMHDLSYWEVRMSSWASTSFASQEYMHEITIPYNNRNLMKLFLRFPVEERKCDIPHKRLIQYGNAQLADMEISIKDSYFGKTRMVIETIYYYYATCLNTYRSKL